MNLKIILLMVCLVGCVQANVKTAVRVAHEVLTAQRHRADWLILVYIAADNNLSSAADLNLRQLKQIGSNSRVTVIAQVSWRSGRKPAKRYLIRKGRLITLSSLGKIDSGNKRTLVSFATSMVRRFPARKLFLDLWDHGSGYVNSADFSLDRSICYDQTHNTIMSSVDVRDALASIYSATHRTFDIIGCDACLMQMLEFGKLIAPYATIMVGSEDTVPDEGFNYVRMLRPFKTRTLSATDFSKAMVRDYASLYNHYFWGTTLSSVRLSSLLLLERNVDTVADLLMQCLAQQRTSVAAAIARALRANTCLHFELYAYVDLGRLYQSLLAQLDSFGITSELKATLTQALNDGLTLLSNAVILKTGASTDANAMGISLCFPVSQVYPSYAQSPFASVNRWVSFLNDYFTGS